MFPYEMLRKKAKSTHKILIFLNVVKANINNEHLTVSLH